MEAKGLAVRTAEGREAGQANTHSETVLPPGLQQQALLKAVQVFFETQMTLHGLWTHSPNDFCLDLQALFFLLFSFHIRGVSRLLLPSVNFVSVHDVLTVLTETCRLHN